MKVINKDFQNVLNNFIAYGAEIFGCKKVALTKLLRSFRIPDLFTTSRSAVSESACKTECPTGSAKLPFMGGTQANLMAEWTSLSDHELTSVRPETL